MTRTGKPLKVAMMMTDLEDLGVQRVVINLYNGLDRTQFSPNLVLWTREGKVASFLRAQETVYETNHGLWRPRFLFRLFRYLRILRELKPDIVLSFVPGTNVSMALIRLFLPRKTGFVACEHAFISRAFEANEYRGSFKVLYLALLPFMYNRIFDRLIMTARAGEDDAVSNWGVDQRRIRVIYNPQDLRELRQRAEEPLEDPWFADTATPIVVAAGRLTKQKGFDSLLRAFSTLVSVTPARLAILGRGELEPSLRNLALELGIAEHVRFLGFQVNHLKYIKNSSVFVLSSLWEAMPMVVAETMAIGTPIVAFDCPSGPREMLDEGRCGYLVPDQDVDALAKAIAHALMHRPEAVAMSDRARTKVERYDIHTITGEYQILLQQVVMEKASA